MSIFKILGELDKKKITKDPTPADLEKYLDELRAEGLYIPKNIDKKFLLKMLSLRAYYRRTYPKAFEEPKPEPPKPPEPIRPEVSEWCTFGGEVTFTNRAKGIQRRIVDKYGTICGFPGVDETAAKLDPELLQPRVRFRTDFERWDEYIAMIWQVQPDGRYWADEDGYGMTPDEEIRLYSLIDAEGRFIQPFSLYDEGTKRYYSYDFRKGMQAAERGDDEEAYRCFKQAADIHVIPAMFNAAVCLLEGRGVERHLGEACSLLREAAKAGMPLAMENLAALLIQDNTPMALREGVHWTRRAAAHGMPQATYNMGVFCEKGIEMPQDYAKALEWYHKASELGWAPADLSIGAAHAEGRGVPADYSEAVKWYEKAAHAGVAQAQYNMGTCYTMGLGVEQNHVKAVEWYRKAVEQNYAQAQFNLASCYANGHGVEQDFKEAARLFQLAADQGLANARQILAVMYLKGLGVEQDVQKAAELLKKE